VIPIPIELLKPFEAAFGKDLSAFEAHGDGDTRPRPAAGSESG
jgi:hypothetical protein